MHIVQRSRLLFSLFMAARRDRGGVFMTCIMTVACCLRAAGCPMTLAAVVASNSTQLPGDAVGAAGVGRNEGDKCRRDSQCKPGLKCCSSFAGPLMCMQPTPCTN